MVDGHSKIKSKGDLQLLRSHAIIWFPVCAEEHPKIIQFPGKSGWRWVGCATWGDIAETVLPACMQPGVAHNGNRGNSEAEWLILYACVCALASCCSIEVLSWKRKSRTYFCCWVILAFCHLTYCKHMVTNCLSTLLCNYQENQSNDSIIRWAGLDGMYVFWLHTLVAEGRKRPVLTLHTDSFSLNMMTSVNVLVPWLLLVFYGLLTC